jgi:DNA polymerase-3 subunit delta
MQLKGAQIQQFAAKPNLSRALLHGPDGGQARHLASILLAKLGDETISFDGDVQVTTLAEAMASSAGLFVARRAVRIRSGGEKLTKTLKEVLALPSSTAPLIVEGGDLPSSSGLRKLFETAKDAVSIGCYPPEGAQRIAWMNSTLAENGVGAEPRALDILASWLPDDSLVARRELEKLALHVGKDLKVNEAHVRELMTDAADAEPDDAYMAAAEGNHAAVERALRRQPGFSAVGILRLAQRHFQRLLAARAAIDGGASAEDAVASLKPPVFFKDQRRHLAQLRRWSVPMLERAVGRLVEGERLCKTTGWPDATLCAHVLHEIATDALPKT